MLEFFHRKRNQKGFTLIELLVVIAIIGILATIVLVSLNSARSKARDARRQSDIHQISLAMEMCYDDVGCGPGASQYLISAALPDTIGTYMANVPDDPQSPGQVYGWVDNTGDSSTYCVYADLEDDSGNFYANEHGTGLDDGTVQTDCDPAT